MCLWACVSVGLEAGIRFMWPGLTLKASEGFHEAASAAIQALQIALITARN